MEIDIFRSWKLVEKNDFLAVQTMHFKKLPH
jgi:hypothetical protein